MVKRLMQARSDCQVQIDAGEQRLQVLDKQIASIEERHRALATRLEQRRAMRDRIVSQLDQSMQHLQGVRGGQERRGPGA